MIPCRWVPAALLMLFLVSGPVRADPAPLFRISTENVADHVQTEAVMRFARHLERLAGSRLRVVHHWHARMFRDRDVLKALGQGKVEMAVPGTWQIDRFVPDVGIFLLPAFYGRRADAIHAVVDGPAGREIGERIEKTLGVVVLGRWIDLGHAHLFGVGRPIRSHRRIAGLKIRVAGGVGNALRIEALGGIPLVIPWPELPEILERGTVDGLLTSFETVAGAELWERGVTHAFKDREYFPQYVPLVRASLWRRLPRDLKALLRVAWESGVDPARRAAAVAQDEAEKILLEKGVSVVRPDEESLAQWRTRIMDAQEGMVRKMGIDRDLLGRITRRLPWP